jgi:site-specific DNA-methyltransferase (adenine-specific)
MLPLDTVIQGDCLEALAKIPDASVNVCFADHPFNLDKKYASYKDSLELEEYLNWCEQWLVELVRITKPSGSILVHNIPRWLTYFAEILNHHAYFRHWIAWDAMSTPLGKTLLHAHYGILFYSKSDNSETKFYEIRAPHEKCRVCDSYLRDYGGKADQRHPFGYLVSDVWKDVHRIRHSKRRDPHPCQLPIPLLERLILMTTDEWDVVLDPFLGTGTTAIAAKQLNRHYVGIELSELYVRVANEKLDAVTEPTLFKGYPVSKYLDEIRSIRDIDAKELFPKQLTTQEKRRKRKKKPQAKQIELPLSD